MKAQADKRRKDWNFTSGDMVLVRLQPYRQLSVQRRSAQKLALRYYGPFMVEERIGTVAYRLKLPDTAKIHPVFHVSLLRPFRAGQHYKIHPLPFNASSEPLQHTPCAIVGERQIWRKGELIQQVLVQWTDLSPEEATWEDQIQVLTAENEALFSKASSTEGEIKTPPLSTGRRTRYGKDSTFPTEKHDDEKQKKVMGVIRSEEEEQGGPEKEETDNLGGVVCLKPQTQHPYPLPTTSVPLSMTTIGGKLSVESGPSNISGAQQLATTSSVQPNSTLQIANPAPVQLQPLDVPNPNADVDASRLEDKSFFRGDGDVVIKKDTLGHGDELYGPKRVRRIPAHFSDFIMG